MKWKATQPTSSTIPTEERRRFQVYRWRSVISILVCAYLAYRSQPRLWPTTLSHYAVCVSGGTIFTAEIENEFVECVAIKGGLVDFVGSRQDLISSQPLLWRSILQPWSRFSLAGLGGLVIHTLDDEVSVLPGLIDAHAHPLEYGESASAVELLGCTSVECVIGRIIDHINSVDRGPDSIIHGNGWDQTLFEGKQFPTAATLSDHPKLRERKIVLRRIDFHAYWVSTSCLNEVLARNPTLNVEGGEIIKDQDGNPTGVFLDNAMRLIDETLPKRTDDDRMTYLQTTAKEMLSVGMTSVHDAAADLETINFYRKLDMQGQLPVRVTAMVYCGYEFCADHVQEFLGERLTIRSVKLMVDGALGSWGAALWEPYLDNNSSRGILRVPADKFLNLTQRWVDAGFQVNSHAIGDRANTIVLEAYEKVLNNLDRTSNPGAPFNSPRLRIEHAQILRPSDIEKMGKLGIIASVQPTHAIADMDYAEARLGVERTHGAYAWNSLLKHNVTLALGSDFPVSPVSPFLGIHAAFSRRKPTLSKGVGDHSSGWYPEERMESLREIIRGFSIRASFAGFNENRTGSLKVGKAADFILINNDLFLSNKPRRLIEDLILETVVLATILDGRVVFGKITAI